MAAPRGRFFGRPWQLSIAWRRDSETDRTARPSGAFAGSFVELERQDTIAHGEDGLTGFACANADEVARRIRHGFAWNGSQTARGQPIAGEGLAKQCDAEPRLGRT